MTAIMTYNVWMARTSLAGRKRSIELRALDAAMLAYQVAPDNSGALLTLKSRLYEFIAKKSGGAVRAVGGTLIGLITKRNGRMIDGVGPVQELYAQVEAAFGAAAGPSGAAAPPPPAPMATMTATPSAGIGSAPFIRSAAPSPFASARPTAGISALA
ncbi:hypothetical+protein [Methylocapsa aurea]|jgi:hypothetical protein